MPLTLSLALLLTVTAFPAIADTAAADACAAGLTAPAKEIYTATRAENPTKATARGIVVAQVEKMIHAGTLTDLDARAAGEAAGKCLELLE
jgi:hypothetical protein